MGGKVNLYLDDASLDRWRSLPNGLRSRIVRQALMNSEVNDPQERDKLLIQETKRKIENVEREIERLESNRFELKKELGRLEKIAPLEDMDVPDSVETSDLYVLANEFWSAFLEQSPDEHEFVRSFKPSKIKAMMKRTALSSVQMGFVIRKNHIRVECYIYSGKTRVDNTLRIFEHLMERRGEIEESFGQQLKWQETSRTARRIIHRVDRFGDDILRNKPVWEDFMQEIGDSMERLWASLRPHLESLPKEE
tara:strand:+ start:486 stop:1238 length:753 start_codon:yes stop_codon:yes gene_type:complete